jgi:YHS domain-containing protein
MFSFDRNRGAWKAAFAVCGAIALAGAAWHAPANAGSVVYGAAKGPAIGGHDPVAYFTEGTPKIGDARFTHDWNGATWRFVSSENRERFKADPERYAPQYGGHCAYAMSTGSFSPGDAKRWRIESGKLYLNANIFAQTLWETNIPGRIDSADAQWPVKRVELEAAP